MVDCNISVAYGTQIVRKLLFYVNLVFVTGGSKSEEFLCVMLINSCKVLLLVATQFQAIYFQTE